jgi:hypothetical protein
MLVLRGGNLGAYDAAADSWRSLGSATLPRENCWSTGSPESVASVTSSRVLAWTGACAPKHGITYDLETGRWSRAGDADGTLETVGVAPGFVYAAARPVYDKPTELVRYAVAADRWEWAAPTPIPLGDNPLVVWTGHDVLVWGGSTERGATPFGAAYAHG